MKLYKLTDQDGYTRRGKSGETQWSEGFTLETNGEGDLCGPGWVHAYTDPLLAVFLNPIHADIKFPLLWECEGEIGKSDRGLKVGCKKLTTIRKLPLPDVTTEQRVRFGILCALEVCEEPQFMTWAGRWLAGTDRTKAAAAEAEAAAWAEEAARAAAWSAEEAARAAKEEIDLIKIARRALEEQP